MAVVLVTSALVIPWGPPVHASAPAAHVAREIVAIGDSYTSGEGAPPFDAASNRPGVNECHRSSFAYPINLGGSLDAPVESWACSGATTGDLSTTVVHTDQAPWDDPILDLSDGAPASALDRIGPGTQMVMLTVGGNDVGFPDIVSDCLLGFESCTRHDAQVRRDLTALEGSLHTLFSDIEHVSRRRPRSSSLGIPGSFPRHPLQIVTSFHCFRSARSRSPSSSGQTRRRRI